MHSIARVAHMVGIVLVSHSERLAHGLRDMLVQVAGEEVPIEAAGGTDDGGLGTSYDRILVAIDRADRGGGVLVLTDLGSAVLTAQTVLEDRVANTAVLVDAPFVEGAVAAAVLAGAGADLAECAQAATEARDVRRSSEASSEASPAAARRPARQTGRCAGRGRRRASPVPSRSSSTAGGWVPAACSR